MGGNMFQGRSEKANMLTRIRSMHTYMGGHPLTNRKGTDSRDGWIKAEFITSIALLEGGKLHIRAVANGEEREGTYRMRGMKVEHIAEILRYLEEGQ